jgi:hypothetical protein
VTPLDSDANPPSEVAAENLGQRQRVSGLACPDTETLYFGPASTRTGDVYVTTRHKASAPYLDRKTCTGQPHFAYTPFARTATQHTAHILQENAGSFRQVPAILATAASERPALGWNPRLSPLGPEAP